MKYIFLISLIWVFVSCATNNEKDFTSVKEGMDKDQILQLLGNPIRTEKNAIREKWAYRYYVGPDKETEVLKYIEFLNGKVVAYGDDIEEIERLQKFKEKEIKKQTEQKKKEKIDEKVEKAYGR